MKPTTSTVVTDEDWMTAVTAAPAARPLNRMMVMRARAIFIFSPARTFSDSLSLRIP